MDQTTSKFIELFAGRRDAFGTEPGGCARLLPQDSSENWYKDHLVGKPIGVYPMVVRTIKPNCSPGFEEDLGWQVKWGCVDLDIRTDKKPSGDYPTEDEAHAAAQNLQNTLRALGVTSWIEVTRSHGRHVWVFAYEWVPAKVMREALLGACQIAGASSREVNPKSESLGEGQLGNYVRLPYPGNTDTCRYVYKPETASPLTCAEFVDLAWANRTATITLADCARLYQRPPPPAPIKPLPSNYYRGELTSKLNGLAYKMVKEGPLGKDRSAYLFKLAVNCAESGLTASEAVVIVSEADVRWTNKFSCRHNPGLYYEQIVRNAYAAAGA